MLVFVIWKIERRKQQVLSKCFRGKLSFHTLSLLNTETLSYFA